MARIDGVALGTIGVGALLLYAGITNKDILAVVQGAIQGKSPATVTTKQAAGTIQSTLTPSQLATVGTGLSGNLGGTGAPQSGTPSVSGNVLTEAAIGALWIAAGGSPSKASVAVCIAMHESSGRTSVTSPNPDGGTNVGLWQLDTPGGKGAGYSISQLQNPLTNARVAIKGSSDGTDWSAWATAPMCGV